MSQTHQTVITAHHAEASIHPPPPSHAVILSVGLGKGRKNRQHHRRRVFQSRTESSVDGVVCQGSSYDTTGERQLWLLELIFHKPLPRTVPTTASLGTNQRRPSQSHSSVEPAASAEPKPRVSPSESLCSGGKTLPGCSGKSRSDTHPHTHTHIVVRENAFLVRHHVMLKFSLSVIAITLEKKNWRF